MKKTLTLLILAAFTFQGLAQDDKKFRFGLKMTPTINWLGIDDKNAFEGGGSVMKFNYGLLTEFHLAGAAWFSTGLQVDYDGGKIKSTATGFLAPPDNSTGIIFYAYDKNKGFLEFDKTDTTYESYWLRQRNYRSMFVTLPLQLRFKTKEIGYLTYFGNFGINMSVHIRTKANDEVNAASTLYASTTELENLKINDDMNFMRLGLVLGGGVEMNLSGTTSLLFGLHFFQGFLNSVKADSKYLLDAELTTAASSSTYTPIAQKQKFLHRNIGLTIGVLF
ncbi:MAG: outer membrane beta-barrel protein [Flavobacteriales bacterium]